MSGTIPPLPNTPSWHCAEFKKSTGKLYLYLYLTCDSVRREVLLIILAEFGIFMKLVKLIKMCIRITIVSCTLVTGRELVLSESFQVARCRNMKHVQFFSYIYITNYAARSHKTHSRCSVGFTFKLNKLQLRASLCEGT
jgi:hypothetical protein